MKSRKPSMDTNCVTVRLADRSIVTIDCQKVEDAFTDNMYERSELDYLLFSDTAAYADLVLNEDPGRYLKVSRSIRQTNP